MLICQECFKDSVMKSIIRRNNILGKCDYCNSENVYIIDMEKMFSKNKEMILDIFKLYVFEYEYAYFDDANIEVIFEDSSKTRREYMEIPYDTLLNILQNEWNFFNLKKIQENEAYEVLLYWTSRLHIPYCRYNKSHLSSADWCDTRYKHSHYFVKEDWDFINTNMKHKYRYNIQDIPTLNFDINELLSPEMFQRLIYVMRKGDKFYRGRIKDKDKTFNRKEMLIPPDNIKSHGRANPIGINYLYAASTIDTVLAEIRAWKNCIVSIATIETKSNLALIDLTFWQNEKSIFLQGYLYDFDIIKRMQYFEIIDLLHKTMSQPVDPREADMEYIFTQYICEKIKVLGYDGIIFKSSLSDGNNIVLFNDENIRVKYPIKDYTVKEIIYIKE